MLKLSENMLLKSAPLTHFQWRTSGANHECATEESAYSKYQWRMGRSTGYFHRRACGAVAHFSQSSANHHRSWCHQNDGCRARGKCGGGVASGIMAATDAEQLTVGDCSVGPDARQRALLGPYAEAFRFRRQPNRPIPARAVANRGKAGSGSNRP